MKLLWLASSPTLPSAPTRSRLFYATKRGVLALYNTTHKTSATRMSKSVRDWFVRTAQEEGWSEAVFINHVETRHSAGCVLYKRSEKMQVNIFLSGDSDEDDE